VTYRSDLDALDARHDALSHELVTKTRELDDATRLLEEARARAKLPILDNIRTASPCRADWNAMLPAGSGDRVRNCGQCEKQVFNLSEMTRQDAEALILEKHGNLCARYYRRHDGTIITADCRVGVVAGRKRKLVAAASLALLGTGIGTAIQRHNRVELDGIDNVEIPAPPEATHGHVRANAKNDAPPPKPVPPPPPAPKVEEMTHVLMGDVDISSEREIRRLEQNRERIAGELKALK
jgi:hypothetical protein